MGAKKTVQTPAASRQYRLRPSIIKLFCIVFVIAAFVSIIPNTLKYFEQKQEIKAVEQKLEQTRNEVAEKQRAVANWDDPNYVRAQSRDRLFYVMPGEFQLGIINDIQLPQTSREVTEKDLTAAKSDWSQNLLGSILRASQVEKPPAQADEQPEQE
ncbi:septum formation initiator family protein [Canibacter sp. lx-45]|uniref:FtsB family cell division protein n=1 Tax=Canibacter zhuwentaonis TaxID=2837491 RepID=UPI001BDC6B63|nr:septum formation initiator family protein [Canibacter zhuwentaonis]MBT1034804.1 septum formation initiator family protein [Canibacter zhuwentaonis]